MYDSNSLFPIPGSPTMSTWISPRIRRPSGMTFGTPLNSCRASASFSTYMSYIDGAIEAVIIRKMSGLALLRVEVHRRLGHQAEFRRARRPFAASLFLIAFERLPERLPVLRLLDDRPATEALEERVRHARTDLGRLAHEALDGDVLAKVLRPQVANRHAPVPGQGFDPQVDLGRLIARRREPPDRLLPRHEDVQRVTQEVDR